MFCRKSFGLRFTCNAGIALTAITLGVWHSNPKVSISAINHHSIKTVLSWGHLACIRDAAHYYEGHEKSDVWSVEWPSGPRDTKFPVMLEV
jgi:hypothetical protein